MIFLEKSNYLKDNKELMKEYDYEANADINLKDLKIGSNKKIGWICNKGHRWKATVYNRVNGTKCPFCTNSKILRGFNDLETLNPNLAKEWDYTKNGKKPCEIGAGTAKKYWWICHVCGYEWEAPVVVRHIKNVGCPECAKEKHTSFPEQSIFYYLQKYYKKYQVYNRYLFENKYEADIYIKKIKLAIEYDGSYYHNIVGSKKRENNKNKYLISNNIKLIRVRENVKNDKLSDDIDIIAIPKNPNYKEIDKALEKVITRINQLYNIEANHVFNTEKDRFKIMDNYIVGIKKNSLLSKYPDIAQEWDYTKNRISPDNVSVSSEKRVWWICSNCKNEWEATISNRTRMNAGCPKCGIKKQLESFNRNMIDSKGSLNENNPTLAKEWNYEKNGELTPNDIIATSNKKVWWKCVKGHEWEASIFKRNAGTGCPYCSNRKVLKGFNDLATKNPELLKEWDYCKNKEIRPEDVVYGSYKKVWWKCSKCGHEWQTLIATRTIQGCNCPICAINK